jgi:hypothetical protein
MWKIEGNPKCLVECIRFVFGSSYRKGIRSWWLTFTGSVKSVLAVSLTSLFKSIYRSI